MTLVGTIHSHMITLGHCSLCNGLMKYPMPSAASGQRERATCCNCGAKEVMTMIGANLPTIQAKIETPQDPGHTPSPSGRTGMP